jgi:hypothetical protein
MKKNNKLYISFQKTNNVNFFLGRFVNYAFKQIYKSMIKACGMKWSNLTREEKKKYFIEFSYEGEMEEIKSFTDKFFNDIKKISSSTSTIDVALNNRSFKNIKKKTKELFKARDDLTIAKIIEDLDNVGITMEYKINDKDVVKTE